MGKKIFILFFIFTELYLLVNMPYLFCRVWPLADIYITSALFVGIIIIFLIYEFERIRLFPLEFNIAFIITITTWIVYSLLHSDSSYLTRVFLLFITYLFLMVINSKRNFVKFWRYNNYFILLQAVFSLIAFILVAVGLLHPLLKIHNSNAGTIYFWGLCFSKTYIGNLIRPSGFLDEPGALAAWAIYSLMFNYAFIKNKLIEKCLTYFTAVTLSVAFFIQILIFVVLSNFKKLYKLAFVAVIVLAGIFLISLTKGTNFDVYEKTIARFERSNETIIEGNNRQKNMDNAKKMFKRSPYIGIGGRAMGKLEDSVADNPYEILAKDGIIGFIVSYIPLIIILFCNRRKEVVISVIVIAVGYLQRPLHINFMHNMYIWSFLLFALKDVRINTESIKRKLLRV